MSCICRLALKISKYKKIAYLAKNSAFYSNQALAAKVPVGGGTQTSKHFSPAKPNQNPKVHLNRSEKADKCVSNENDILSISNPSNMTIHTHHRLPVSIFNILRKVSSDKILDYKTIFKEIGVEWERRQVVEKIVVGSVELPVKGNDPKFRYLTEIKKKLKYCNQSLQQFTRRDSYFIEKGEEYHFLTTIVNLSLLRFAVHGAQSLEEKQRIVQLSAQQAKLFMESCPFLYIEHVNQAAPDGNDSRRMRLHYHFSRISIFKNPIFARGVILEYLFEVHMSAFGLDHALQWIMNNEQRYTLDVPSLSQNMKNSDIYVKMKDRVSKPVVLNLSNRLCDYILMKLCKLKNFEAAYRFLEFSKTVHNLQSDVHVKKIEFNKALSSSTKTPQSIMAAFSTIENPSPAQYGIVVRGLLETQLLDPNSSAEDSSYLKEQRSYVFNQINTLLPKIISLNNNAVRGIVQTILYYFKAENHHGVVIQVYEKCLEKIGTEDLGIKCHTVALQSYFELLKLDDALIVARRIEDLNGGVLDGHALVVYVKNLWKNAMQERAFEAFEKFKKSGQTISQRLYTVMMGLLISNGNLGGASALWTDMIDAGLKPQSNHFAIFIRGYFNFNDMEKARDVFNTSLMHFGVEPDICMYNALLSGYIKKKLYADALAVLRDIQTKGIETDASYECILIKLYSLLDGTEEEMINAFHRYRKKCGHFISGYALNPIIRFYAARQEYRNVFFFLDLLNGSEDLGKIEQEFVDNMIPLDGSTPLPPTTSLSTPITHRKPVLNQYDKEIAHETILNSLYAERINGKLVDAYVNSMAAYYRYPMLFDSYMNYLIIQNRYQELRDFFYTKVLETGPPSQRIILTYIKGMQRLGDLSECQRWLLKIIDMGYPPCIQYFQLCRKVSKTYYVMGSSRQVITAREQDRAVETRRRRSLLRSVARRNRKSARYRLRKELLGKGVDPASKYFKIRMDALDRWLKGHFQKMARRRGGAHVKAAIKTRKVVMSQLRDHLSKANLSAAGGDSLS